METEVIDAVKLAIEGGQPVRPKPIAPTVTIGPELRARISALLDSGELSDYYNGACAHQLEEAFARYHGPDFHAVAVNSATSALHLSLAAAGVGPGDEVILPALCFVSAATAVVQLGALPIICDVEPHSLTLDVAAAERLIGPRTKAVLPVHFWGYPADLPSLRALCDRHGLSLIEDSAQAPGAPVGGRKTGTYGDFAAYSFSNRKHVTCGEGGMVMTRSVSAAKCVRSLSNVGKGPGWDDYWMPGFSYRLVEFSALVALYGLQRIDEEIAARQRAADCYREALAGSGLEPVPHPAWGRSVHFKLPILLPPDSLASRAFMVEAINAENVSCRVPHRPLFAIPWLTTYLQERACYRGAADCPVSAALYPRLIEVETGPHLPLDEAAKSVFAVQKVWSRVRTERQE